jgi:Flp pilus assembly protein TadB
MRAPVSLLAVVLAGLAAVLASGGPAPAARRLGTVLPPPDSTATIRRPAVSARLLVSVLASVTVGTLVAPPLGVLLALPAALLVHRRLPDRWLPGSGAADRRRMQDIRSAAPLACDLLAATVSAGVPLDRGIRAVAAATDGPIGEVLADVAAWLSLGAAPEEAWAAVERAPPLRPLARAVVRSSWSGAALAASLTGLADDLREAAYADGQAAARRAGVQVVGPLTLCFLPAFVVLGVLPFVLGLFADALS